MKLAQNNISHNAVLSFRIGLRYIGLLFGGLGHRVVPEEERIARGGPEM